MPAGIRASNFMDLSGRRFGSLTAISHVPGSSPTKWNVACDCGTEKIVGAAKMVHGTTKSCGCRKGSMISEAQSLAPDDPKKKYQTEYFCWRTMNGRCQNKSQESWEYYGGRGIAVCERWRTSFDVFISDMGPRPSDRHSIDRVNVDGNYEPGNCRWATPEEQASNKRNNVNLTVNGRTQHVAAWSRETGIRDKIIYERIATGWPHEDAVTRPVRKLRRKTESAHE